MNKILVIIVIILFPLTLVTKPKESYKVLNATTLENIKLEIPIENNNNKDENNYQVLISNNNDKSDPYYIDLEEYIMGVVAGEMPASFDMEALKAQAVAARTYALYKMKNIDDYVLSTTINDQVYLTNEQMQTKWGIDFEHYYNRVKNAVNDTKGEVITYDDNIIISYYFAISNGYTDDAKVVFNEDRSYLVSVDSKWDKEFSSYSSSREMAKEDFCNKLGINCDEIIISNIIRGNNNYVRQLTINNKTLTGQEVFNKLSLKSTDFEIIINNKNIIINTYGFGHGVGMSQYGAQGMARDGYSYKDILEYYYKNTKISNI